MGGVVVGGAAVGAVEGSRVVGPVPLRECVGVTSRGLPYSSQVAR